MILIAKPRISSGDVDAMSDSVRQAATTLTLTIMGKIQRVEQGYVLVNVGVGYSVPIQDQQTVITSDTQSSLGANLGFIQRRVLSANETALAEVRNVAQGRHFRLFDAPAIMKRQREHVKLITRHFVWIDPASGNGSMLAWLLKPDGAGSFRVVAEPAKWLGFGTVEQRRIHVDGNEFTLGIPSDLAFALEDLPPGKSVAMTPELAPHLERTQYSKDDLRQLFESVTQACRRAQ